MIRVESTTRWDGYRDADQDVVALRFRYDPAVILIVKNVLATVRDETGSFAGTWDNDLKFWWCYPWAWEAVRDLLDEQGVDYDDSGVDDFFAPPNAGANTKQQARHETPRTERPRQPHEVLGVSITASELEIHTAYRNLAKQWHPDRIPHDVAFELRDLANRRMAEINSAHDALKSRNSNATS